MTMTVTMTKRIKTPGTLNIETRNMTCIGCPIGCNLEVLLEDSKVINVNGNSCKRGIDYGTKECTNPTRILTTTVSVTDGELEVVPVKTEKDIPKNCLQLCMKEIKKVKLAAPVHIGDIIVYNILGTGVNIVATKNVEIINKA